ncbi:phosphatase with homology to tensin [Anaeramoeba flamelloides]|uniref:Phosphatidylinositol 3,4,5-trisphosphate 3-phosphatase and dual-specificity protein phosphatase PTEN n=1 Tax=Anaeramoeba flamelloides TaxID=1746091 RepID=A0ABQ8XUT3_9EUKA|nr:phosphatase with homology to tensin [Anaeramoeba flamelloides]
MTNKIRTLVSKKKKRLKASGFNLDMSYITSQIITMGFPATKLEGMYRNKMSDVLKYLDKNHKENYYVYNLCSEKDYDSSCFYGRVEKFPFDDHNPPPIELMEILCKHSSAWLGESEDRVVVIHCKAGKGRTGVMACCLLIYLGIVSTAEEALNFYAKQRTKNQKGVTIPSQRRYVRYFEKIFKNGLKPLHIATIKKVSAGPLKKLEFLPKRNKNYPRIEVSNIKQEIIYSSENKMVDFMVDNSNHCTVILREAFPCFGDIRISFFFQNEKLFDIWFNSAYIEDMQLSENKSGLDKMVKNKSIKYFHSTVDFEEVRLFNQKEKKINVASYQTVGITKKLLEIHYPDSSQNNLNVIKQNTLSPKRKRSFNSKFSSNTKNNSGNSPIIFGKQFEMGDDEADLMLSGYVSSESEDENNIEDDQQLKNFETVGKKNKEEENEDEDENNGENENDHHKGEGVMNIISKNNMNSKKINNNNNNDSSLKNNIKDKPILKKKNSTNDIVKKWGINNSNKTQNTSYNSNTFTAQPNSPKKTNNRNYPTKQNINKNNFSNVKQKQDSNNNNRNFSIKNSSVDHKKNTYSNKFDSQSSNKNNYSNSKVINSGNEKPLTKSSSPNFNRYKIKLNNGINTNRNASTDTNKFGNKNTNTSNFTNRNTNNNRNNSFNKNNKANTNTNKFGNRNNSNNKFTNRNTNSNINNSPNKNIKTGINTNTNKFGTRNNNINKFTNKNTNNNTNNSINKNIKTNTNTNKFGNRNTNTNKFTNNNNSNLIDKNRNTSTDTNKFGNKNTNTSNFTNRNTNNNINNSFNKNNKASTNTNTNKFGNNNTNTNKFTNRNTNMNKNANTNTNKFGNKNTNTNKFTNRNTNNNINNSFNKNIKTSTSINTNKYGNNNTNINKFTNRNTNINKNTNTYKDLKINTRTNSQNQYKFLTDTSPPSSPNRPRQNQSPQTNRRNNYTRSNTTNKTTSPRLQRKNITNTSNNTSTGETKPSLKFNKNFVRFNKK